jgi:UDP-glucose 4-epimerase
MNVLVTGGAGYIGSLVARDLAGAGHRVWIVDDFSTGRREVAAALTGPGFAWEEGDVGDAAGIARLLRRVTFQSCVHLAGSIRVEESMVRPDLYYRNNLRGSLVLLEALARAGVPSLVFSSTAAVYGVPDSTPILEDHPTHPTNTYGETKLAFERALRWFRGAGGPRFVALRYFNAAGAASDGLLGEGHEPETHLIPNLLRAASAGTPVSVYGDDYPTPDGTCVRDYVHVEDLARAHRLAVERLAGEELPAAINLGSGCGFSVREVIKTVEAVTGARLRVEMRPRRAGDPPILVADPGRARARLGWVPDSSTMEKIVGSAWAWEQRPR